MKSLRQTLRLFLGPVLVVVLPTAVLFGYWEFFYTPRFSTEVVVMAGGGDEPVSDGNLTNLLGSVRQTRSTDATLLQHYLLSPDILLLLDGELGLRERWSAAAVDRWQRLAPDAPFEDLLAYYRRLVEVTPDTRSPVLRVRISAFSPAEVQALTDRLLFHADARLREVSRQMAEEQLRFIESEVKKADRLLRERRARLLAHQRATGQFDPETYSETLLGLIGSLEAQLAEERTRLGQDLGVHAPESLELVRRRARVAALEAEIARQRDRLSGAPGGGESALLPAIMEHEALAMEADFATKAYTASSLALQSAKAHAAINLRSLTVISRLPRAESPSHPRTLYWTFTSLAVGCLCYGLARLLYDTIAWHTDR